MENQIGITIQEGISNGLNVGSTVNTRNLGVLMNRVRGVPNVPFLVTSPTEDKSVFGGYNSTMFSPYTIDLLFRNLGGFNVNIFGIRIVGAGSTAATIAVEEAAAPFVTFTAGRQGATDPGTWGNDLKVKLYGPNHPQGTRDAYVIEVLYKNVLVERYMGTVWNDIAAQVNGGSAYVVMTVQNNDVVLADEALTTHALAGGTFVAPVEADYEPKYDEITGEPKGLALFEGVDAQILFCPEIFSAAFQVKCRDFVADRKINKHFVFNLPFNATESVMQTYATDLEHDGRTHINSFGQWVEVDNGAGGRIWIPGIGYYIGAGFIRAAALNNGRVWTPPAGMDTAAMGVIRFTHDNLGDQTLDRYAKQWKVNMAKFVAGRGFVIWTSRTYSTNTLYASIHVDLMTNWLISSLAIRSIRFLQRLNQPSLRKEIRVDHMAFFRNLYQQGGIEQTVPFDKAVIIQVETSAESRRDIIEEIAWIPPETTESLLLKLNRNDGSLVIQG